MLVASNYVTRPKPYDVQIKVEKIEEGDYHIEDVSNHIEEFSNHIEEVPYDDENIKMEPLDILDVKPKKTTRKSTTPRLKIALKRLPDGESNRSVRRSTAENTARVAAEKARQAEEKLKIKTNKNLLEDSLGISNEPPREKKKLGPQPPNEDDARIKEIVNMTCDLCSTPFGHFSEVIYHFKRFHKGTKGYLICCGKKYRKRYRLVEHMNSHYNIQYPCEVCGKKFYTKTVLKKHLLMHAVEKNYVSQLFGTFLTQLTL